MPRSQNSGCIDAVCPRRSTGPTDVVGSGMSSRRSRYPPMRSRNRTESLRRRFPTIVPLLHSSSSLSLFARDTTSLSYFLLLSLTRLLPFSSLPFPAPHPPPQPLAVSPTHKPSLSRSAIISSLCSSLG